MMVNIPSGRSNEVCALDTLTLAASARPAADERTEVMWVHDPPRIINPRCAPARGLKKYNKNHILHALLKLSKPTL